MFLIVLLLSFVQFTNIDWHEPLNYYNQAGDTPETIWASVLMYHSVADEVKSDVIKNLDSELVKYGLKQGGSFKESIEIINERFNDESLLLLLLLLEGDVENREISFNHFYDKNDAGQLHSINLYAKRGLIIDLDEIDFSEFHFYQFLISFYVNTNQLVDERFFDLFSNYWFRRLDINSKSFKSELLIATTIKTAYDRNDSQMVNNIYDPSIQLALLPPSILKRNLFWGIDFVLGGFGYIDKSIAIQRDITIPLSILINNQGGLNSIKISHGVNHYQLGNYQAARSIFLSVYEEIENLSDPLKVRLYNNLSLIYFKTGQSSEYIETQLKALQIAQELNNFDLQNRIYRNLHVFYRKYQNLDLARQYIELAADLALESGNTQDLISIYISQAVFESQYLNNKNRAYEKLDLAESFFDDQTESRLRVRVLSERTKLFNSDGRWEESKNIQNEIIQIAANQNDTASYLGALADLAFIYYQLGEYNQAAQTLREFRAHDISILDFTTLVLSQTLRAQLFVESGDLGSADREFSHVADLVLERARNTSEHETGYWNIEPEYLQLFEAYTDFLIDNGNISEAIILLDRIKTINDASLIENPLIQAANLSDSELAHEKNLTEQMDRLRKQIFSSSGQERLALQSQLEMLSAQRRSLLGSDSSKLDYKNIKIWSLKRKLRSDQILLHITEINSNYYISRIDRNQVTVEKLNLSEENRSMIENAVESIVTGQTNLNKLYQIGKLLQVDSLPNHISSIILIPDGFFHQLPLSVLPIREPASPYSYGSARYLIEEKDVYTLNSLNELLDRTPRGQFKNDFTGFGVSDFNNEITSRNLISLPKAPQEIYKIQNTLNRFSSVVSITNDKATTQSFNELAAGSRILHMATHSEVSESDPLFSRLHFYSNTPSQNGEVESGQLFAYELFNLNLNNELVMLNSCDSGGDRYLQGSGIMGINRALRYAGVQSLILNSWSVNDKFAADFAELFYFYLNEGKTKSKALQLAKIEFIRTKNANPHYWGPYTMNGNNRPLIKEGETSKSGYILLALFLFMAVSIRRSSLS